METTNRKILACAHVLNSRCWPILNSFYVLSIEIKLISNTLCMDFVRMQNMIVGVVFFGVFYFHRAKKATAHWLYGYISVSIDFHLPAHPTNTSSFVGSQNVYLPITFMTISKAKSADNHKLGFLECIHQNSSNARWLLKKCLKWCFYQCSSENTLV